MEYRDQRDQSCLTFCMMINYRTHQIILKDSIINQSFLEMRSSVLHATQMVASQLFWKPPRTSAFCRTIKKMSNIQAF